MKEKEKEYGDKVFAERYIEGKEISVSMLSTGKGPQILPAAWVKFNGYDKESYKILDYKAKWEQNSTQYRRTKRSFGFDPAEAKLLSRVREISLILWDKMGLNGYARIDFRVEDKKYPW